MTHPGAKEKHFKKAVVELAERCGWKWMHIGLSVRPLPGGTYHEDGTWTGKLAGDKESKGFPDLLLVRERILYRELKTNARSSKVEPEQQEWIDALRAAGADVDVWRPAMFDTVIVPCLSRYRGTRQ